MEIREAQKAVAAFAAERAWDINTPSQRGNHIMREVGKLCEHLLFMEGVTTKQPTSERDKQVGDVLFSLIQLANRLDIDLEEQLKYAMKKDAEKYPAKETKSASERAYVEKMRQWVKGI